MNNQIKDKIAKVLELTSRGVAGEKAAAEKALQRLMQKYNLSDEDLSRVKLKRYWFRYHTHLDVRLFCQLVNYFFQDRNLMVYKSSINGRQLYLDLEYLDWVTLDSAYEYFKRHAAQQFREFCLPHVNRCRTLKTKNAKRQELQEAFLSKYVIASNIYRPEQLKEIDYMNMSNKERESHYRRGAILGEVQGGEFHTQISKQTKRLT